jgi:hypothetical protein
LRSNRFHGGLSGQSVERIQTSFTDYAHKQLSLDATLGLSIHVTDMWGFWSGKDGQISSPALVRIFGR